MKKLQVLYQNGSHRWEVVARDPERATALIDTNEYLVSSAGESLLTDPGGMEIFPAVFSALATATTATDLRWIFSSHQDPDVISSLALWLEFNPEIKCYASKIWHTFLPHYGGDANTFICIPDEGQTINLGRIRLHALPAHYLHSSGNFHLYDPVAHLLFSGDVGAAMLPPEEDKLFVSDFDRHIKHATGFHRRWMGSRDAVLDWCERATALGLDMMCPQHGAIYQGPDVGRFINWFAELQVGTGLRNRTVV